MTKTNLQTKHLVDKNAVLKWAKSRTFILPKDIYCLLPEYPKKNTNLSQVTDKLYQILLYRVHLVLSGILIYNVSGDNH